MLDLAGETLHEGHVAGLRAADGAKPFVDRDVGKAGLLQHRRDRRGASAFAQKPLAVPEW